MILVGNKTDLSKERKIKEKDGESLGKKYEIPFYESSALSGYNIDKIFIESCDMINDLIKKGGDEKEFKGITKKKGRLDQIDNLNNSIIKRIEKDRDNNSSSCCFH